jgi:hypothetical protein
MATTGIDLVITASTGQAKAALAEIGAEADASLGSGSKLDRAAKDA